MNNYKWTYGDNGQQTYYEWKNGKDYICIYANKHNSNPNMYMAMYIKNGGSVTIFDKVYNDRQRKKGHCTPDGIPLSSKVLGSTDIEYMKKKAVYCYEHNKTEVTP